MKIALDTNLLLDILLPDPKFGPQSLKLLEAYYEGSQLIISELVYSELSSMFKKQQDLDNFLDSLSINLVKSSREVLHKAGQTYKKYRSRGGAKKRMLADFLIACHTLENADYLFTRDLGFYKGYFPKLKIKP